MGEVLKHQIKQGDTLQGLAKKYFGNAERWYEIAFYNNLTYPYITLNTNSSGVQKATGEVTFSIPAGFIPYGFGLSSYGSSPYGSAGGPSDGYGVIEIPLGTIVTTKNIVVFGTNTTQHKSYVTLQPLILSENNLSGTVTIEAIAKGEIGNTPEYTITNIDDPMLAGVSVINHKPITGGETINVKKPGDSILIPIDVGDYDPAITVETFEDAYDKLFGEDLYLFDSTENWRGANAIVSENINLDLIADESGDLMSIKGIDNLTQALILRVITSLGEIPRNPEYGSNLISMIGKGGTPMALRMMTIEVAKTIRSDPRIIDATDITLTSDPERPGVGNFRIQGKAVVVGQDQPISLDMVVTGG